jgi:hypothetical protein
MYLRELDPVRQGAVMPHGQQANGLIEINLDYLQICRTPSTEAVDRNVGRWMYAEFASRDAVEKLRLDGAPTPRSWVARMTKRPNTNWCRQERLPAEARHVGSAAMSDPKIGW